MMGDGNIFLERLVLLLFRCQRYSPLSTLLSFLKAFAPSPSFFSKSVTFGQTSTLLEACRTNAKKEKIKRNRENMRKFRTGGKKGVSTRKLLKKAQASKARQTEAEFIVKCYMTVPPPATSEDSN
jgi:hypothetical protein